MEFCRFSFQARSKMSTSKLVLCTTLLQLCFFARTITPFTIPSSQHHQKPPTFLSLLSSSSSILIREERRPRGSLTTSCLGLAKSSTPPNTDNDVASLRVSEIRKQLQELNVDFSDCFDKESLVVRLQNARDGTVEPITSSSQPPPPPSSSQAQQQTEHKKKDTAQKKEPIDLVDKEAVLVELRAMPVRALREELASYRMRWAGLIEKEDLVQAVLQARTAAAAFSATGRVQPGLVADLTGAELQQEIEFMASNGGSTQQQPAALLLVDVYAVWCGPCKVMAEQLVQAAAEMGNRIRVVKMDSDKHPDMAGKLGVQGLPTLLLYKNGEEVDRIEGALMKSQLVDWVNNKT